MPDGSVPFFLRWPTAPAPERLASTHRYNPLLRAPRGTPASAAPHWELAASDQFTNSTVVGNQVLATRAILREIGEWPLFCPLRSNRKFCQEAKDADQDGSSRVHQ